jgi:hypothetical protein
VIHAYSCRRDAEIRYPKAFQNVLANRPFRLLAQTPHLSRRVITSQRGEINTGQSLQKPGSLVVFLYRAPRSDGGSPTLNRAAINANPPEQIRIEVDTGITLNMLVVSTDGVYV